MTNTTQNFTLYQTDEKTGNEEFTLHGSDTGITLKDFWKWAYSDLLDNTQRGIMAEFLVSSSLKANGGSSAQIRTNWFPYDITSPSGRHIEVKSAAYLQSWTTDFHSQIKYDIAPKLAWDGKNYTTEAKRNCDLFVFCLYTALTHDKPILNLDYWEFYVLPVSVINDKVPAQKTISLSSLLKLEPVKTDYSRLGTIIETINL